MRSVISYVSCCISGALVCIGFACGDGEGTVVLAVDVVTNYVAGIEYSRVRTSVQVGSEERARTFDAEPLADYIEGVRVASFDLPEGQYLIRVELLAADGRIIATREQEGRVQNVTVATVMIDRECAGLICPAGDDPLATECSGSVCVRPTCSPEQPADCPQLCASNAECEMNTLCTETICTLERVCLRVPIASFCAGSEYCDFETGCRPRTTFSDSGVADVSDSGAQDPDSSMGDHDSGSDALPPGPDAGCGGPCAVQGECQVGTLDCSGGTPTCVASPRLEGVLCGEGRVEAGFGPCDYSSQCDTTASRSQSVSTSTCQGGVCLANATTETQSCQRETEGMTCNATMTDTGTCPSFAASNPCVETRSQTVTTTRRLCMSGQCNDSVTTENVVCRSRETDGDTCLAHINCAPAECGSGRCQYEGAFECPGGDSCCDHATATCTSSDPLCAQ